MYEELIESLEQAIQQVRELQKRERNFWDYDAEYYLKDDREKKRLKIFELSTSYVDLRGVTDISKRICGSIESVKEEVIKVNTEKNHLK